MTANHADNPWLPDGLRADMERDRRRDPDRYAHVWMGGYDAKGEARVFRNWRIAEDLVAPDNAVFRFGADWGFAADPTVLVRCWISGRSLCVRYAAIRENITELKSAVHSAGKMLAGLALALLAWGASQIYADMRTSHGPAAIAVAAPP